MAWSAPAAFPASAAIAQGTGRHDRRDASSTPSFSSSSRGCEKFHSKYLLGGKLGTGAFGQVRVGISVDDSDPCAEEVEEFAVKIINLKAESVEEREKAVKSAQAEESVWKVVGKHKNCVNLLEVFHGNVFSYMVMEKCSSCLLRHIHYMPRVNEHTLGQLFVGMLQGLDHLHSVRVVHRDVKPDNFMIGPDLRTVKLCDFGLSQRLNGSGKMSGICGTPHYICPEMLQKKDYDGRADVWSLGVIVYTFLFGNFPYTGKKQTTQAVMEAILVGNAVSFEPPWASFRTESALSFVKALLVRDMEVRPSAAEALKMKFMEDVGDSQPLATELPSLRPVLLAAVKLGAFGMIRERELDRHNDVECILNDLQLHKHGLSLRDVKEKRFMAVPAHSMPPIKSKFCKGATAATEVPTRKCSDDVLGERSTSYMSGISSCKTTAPGSKEWSKESCSYQWTVAGSAWSKDTSYQWKAQGSAWNK